MKRAITMLLVFVYLITTSGILFAGGGGLTGGALEATQLLNKAELIKQVEQAVKTVNNQITQITNQITMIQDMIKNTMSLPSQLFSPVARIYSQIKDVMNRTRGIVFTMSNFDQEFKNTFKSYSDLQSVLTNSASFGTELQRVTDAQRETVRSTLEGMGVVGRAIEDDAEVLNQLQQKASTADGRNQILNAGNQLLAFQAQELVKLRQMIVMFEQMVGTTIEAERTKQDIAIERTRKINAVPPPTNVPDTPFNPFDEKNY
jgi:P-type conjugative transfer protein TrbJ